MRKPRRFDDLSPVKCVCGKRLKWNLVFKKQSGPLKCFKCWLTEQAERGHNVYHHFKPKKIVQEDCCG